MENTDKVVIKNADQLNSYINVADSIKEMKISTVTNLDNIDSFCNLTKLEISALNSIELYEDILIDSQKICGLKQLSCLLIENDDHIEKLTLPGVLFTNIDVLSISSCHLLKNIEKLFQQHKLRTLILYDVPNLDKTFYDKLVNFLDYSMLDRVILDINTYTLFSDEQLEKLKEYHVQFAEKIGIRDNYIFTPKMMEEFNKKIIAIYNEVHSKYNHLYDILRDYYKYVKSTEYDAASLEKRHKFTIEGGHFYKYANRYKSINSSYKALMKHSAVCEGYVNLLRYLYNLESVDLYPVFCEFEDSSHVAGKAFLDGMEVYFDPELDHRFNNCNNFMISKSEFERHHDILFYRDNFDIIDNVKNRVRE